MGATFFFILSIYLETRSQFSYLGLKISKNYHLTLRKQKAAS